MPSLRTFLPALLCTTALWSPVHAVAAETKGPALTAGNKAAAKRTVLQFESTLKDEEQKPVSGIFPMQFELRKPNSAKAFWKEKHWVAVDNGKYALQLGRETALPKALDPKTAVLVVAIVGAGEIMHEPLAGEAALTQIDGAVGAGSGSGKRIVQYAEKSGFAYEAERAASADRIGQYTAKLLADTLDALDKRKVKVKVGRNHVNLSSVGGAGGTPFELICPPGTVSVGIRGGAGIYIDNFQVVCAPLE
jgi:hypothetical protein